MFLKKVFFIIYYWGQLSLKMDSAEIVFAEVQQVIGKTGKYSNLWHFPKYGIKLLNMNFFQEVFSVRCYWLLERYITWAIAEWQDGAHRELTFSFLSYRFKRWYYPS